MKTILILSAALIVLGEAVLGYGDYRYTSKEHFLQIGPVAASAEQAQPVSFPPIIGWLLIGGGACVLGCGALSKKH